MGILPKKEKEKKPGRRRRWLRITIGMKISFVLTLMLAALGLFSVVSTRGIFKWLMVGEELLYIHSIGSTSLGIIGTVNSEKACNLVRDVYVAIPEEDRKEAADPVYLSKFPDFDIKHDDIDEQLVDSVLAEIKERNSGVRDVGLCLLDDENKRIVIIRSTQSGIPCGFWTDFDYTRFKPHDIREGLYSFHESKNSENIKIMNLRVLIPIDESSTGNLSGFMYIDQENEELYRWTLAFSIIYVFLYLIVIILVWIVIRGFMRSLVIKPIKKMSKAANQWADSPDKLADVYYFDKLKIKTNDELGDLCEAMQSMETELHSYMTHLEDITKEKQRVSTELEIAARLQANMLPDKLELPGQQFTISSMMKPARMVGGDFYDFFMIGEDRLAMIIADVSDKGVPASLFMVVSKTLVGNRLKDDPDDIAAALNRANTQLYETNKELMFVTVFAGIYSLKDRTLTYVNAGHEDPIIYRKDEDKYSYIIEDHDLFMGVDPDINFTERCIPFAQGDRLFLYTDGVTEAMNTVDELFGPDRLLETLNRNSSMRGEEVINALWNEINDFQKGKNQSDDVTMLLFEA